MDLMNGTGYYKGSFGIETSFSFGAPRLGNKKLAETFRRLLGHEIFRVTHHHDALLQYPRAGDGFEHPEHELYFPGNASVYSSSYVRCTVGGENPHCSMGYKGEGSVADNVMYMQPLMDIN